VTRKDWRLTEQALVAFFISHRVHPVNVAGMPVVEIVRYREANEIGEADEIVTVSLSLEHFAKYLAEHFGIPA
jgi:hypothetical protein